MGAPAPAPDRTLISRAEYADLRDLCAEIESAAEGKPYAVLGVGKSSAGVVAMFRALDRSNSFHLPLTSFRFGETDHAELEEKLIPKLFAYFDSYLPTDEAVGGKRLLITDFVGSGSSMRALDRYLQRYVKDRGRKLDVRYVPLNLGTPPALPDGAFPVTIGPQWLRESFVANRWDNLAPRGDYDVRRDERPRPGYGIHGDFVEALTEKIKADRSMTGSLAPNRRFPSPPASDCRALSELN